MKWTKVPLHTGEKAGLSLYFFGFGMLFVNLIDIVLPVLLMCLGLSLALFYHGVAFDRFIKEKALFGGLRIR